MFKFLDYDFGLVDERVMQNPVNVGLHVSKWMLALTRMDVMKMAAGHHGSAGMEAAKDVRRIPSRWQPSVNHLDSSRRIN
jgi:hypothetical protein